MSLQDWSAKSKSANSDTRAHDTWALVVVADRLLVHVHFVRCLGGDTAAPRAMLRLGASDGSIRADLQSTPAPTLQRESRRVYIDTIGISLDLLVEIHEVLQRVVRVAPAGTQCHRCNRTAPARS